ncbi:MAG: hypothetical protein RIS70_2226 [Planctomycetota bacterium]
MKSSQAIVLAAGLVMSLIGIVWCVPCPIVDDAFYKSPAAEWIQNGQFAIPAAKGFLPQVDITFACYPPVFQMVLAGWYALFGFSLRSSLGFVYSIHVVNALLIARVAGNLGLRFFEGESWPVGRRDVSGVAANRELRTRLPDADAVRGAWWFATTAGLIQLCNLALFDRLEELAICFLWTGWLLTPHEKRHSWLGRILVMGLCLGAAALTVPWVGFLGATLVVFRETFGLADRYRFDPSHWQTGVRYAVRHVVGIGAVSLAMVLIWLHVTETFFPGAIDDQFLGTLRHLRATQLRGTLTEQGRRLLDSLLYSPGQLPATALTWCGLIAIVCRGRSAWRAIPFEALAIGATSVVGLVLLCFTRPEAYTYLNAIQMLLLPCLGVAVAAFATDVDHANTGERDANLEGVRHRFRQRGFMRSLIVSGALGVCVLAAIRDPGTVAWHYSTLSPRETAGEVASRLRGWIPATDRVAVTARHWHAFQGRNDWREAFFSSRIEAGEVLACEWLVLPKDCGRPDFLGGFELVEQIETDVPSHHTYAYDLYRRRQSTPISVESDSTDAEPSHRDSR